MRILVLNHFFRAFTGSELNALQLAVALRAGGHTPDIGTFEPGEPMRSLAAARGMRALDLIAATGTVLEYDLIWAHHAPLLTHVVFHRELAPARLLFSSLSPLTALESPPAFWPDIELILAHSPFNREYLEGLGIPPARVRYFPNSFPASYLDHPRPPDPGEPRNIAVVSHHPPDEVWAMAAAARRDGRRVEFIGRERARLVDERVLPRYDLVVTIGKTVPSAFAQRVPVYCYDHFGGPGYITAENFTRAEHGNFCGRSFWRKISGPAMYREILEGYAAATADLPWLREQARSRFCLETNLEALAAPLAAMPLTDFSALRRRHVIAGRLNDIYVEALRERLMRERTWDARVSRRLRSWGRRGRAWLQGRR